LINFIWDMWDKWCKYKFTDPVFSFAKTCLAAGVTLLAGGVGWAIVISVTYGGVPASIEIGPSQPTFVGLLLIAVGLVLGIWRIQKTSNTVGCFLIVHKGMPGMELGNPQSSLPGVCRRGEIREIQIPFLQDKQEVMRKIESVSDRIQQDNHHSTESSVLAYAGMAPIPFLFYTGHILTNRKHVKFVLDWDRDYGTWHDLGAKPQRIELKEEKPITKDIEEIAIVMPLSVEISALSVHSTTGQDVPILWLRLPEGATRDSLNSEKDQASCATQFYNCLAGIRNEYPALRMIHLFVAAQASFVFRLGQSYTTSTHPPVTVYGFNGETGVYDWSIAISEQKAELQQH
jgi:SMODS-associated and fused to various effectors sensor domain